MKGSDMLDKMESKGFTQDDLDRAFLRDLEADIRLVHRKEFWRSVAKAVLSVPYYLLDLLLYVPVVLIRTIRGEEGRYD